MIFKKKNKSFLSVEFKMNLQILYKIIYIFSLWGKKKLDKRMNINCDTIIYDMHRLLRCKGLTKVK